MFYLLYCTVEDQGFPSTFCWGWPPSYELKKVNNKFWGSFKKIWGSKPSKFKETRGSWKTLEDNVLYCMVGDLYIFVGECLGFKDTREERWRQGRNDALQCTTKPTWKVVFREKSAWSCHNEIWNNNRGNRGDMGQQGKFSTYPHFW